jgi:predicted metal-dependent hydrolase
MPTLQVGRRGIPYELRRSATAVERRITVTPGHVEVLALAKDDEAAVAGFLDRKRQWLFNTVREMERITAEHHAVPRFMTGSKIPYRGRRMPLIVRRHDGPTLDISYRNGFYVDLPAWIDADADALIARELKLWLKSRARRDALDVAKRCREMFDLRPSSIQIVDLRGGWGSCGPKGNIAVNWTLIFAPRLVFDYVVMHELAHLRERSHDAAFWNFMAELMPGYEVAKSWLASNEHHLSAAFLEESGAAEKRQKL